MNRHDEFDAVAWLRSEADACLSDMLEDTARKLKRAADEIEALREHVEWLRADNEYLDRSSCRCGGKIVSVEIGRPAPTRD